jgi:hypothetical protein
MKTAGCGISRKYTKFTNLQTKTLQTFYKNSIINQLYSYKIHLHTKSSVCWCFLEVDVKFALPFLRNAILGDKRLKIFMPA